MRKKPHSSKTLLRNGLFAAVLILMFFYTSRQLGTGGKIPPRVDSRKSDKETVSESDAWNRFQTKKSATGQVEVLSETSSAGESPSNPLDPIASD